MRTEGSILDFFFEARAHTSYNKQTNAHNPTPTHTRTRTYVPTRNAQRRTRLYFYLHLNYFCFFVIC
jgi:hypothetical protein